MKAIINGSLVLQDGVLQGEAVLFEKNICKIIPMSEVPKDIEIVDANGGTVMPGLFDVHVHGSGGCDTMDGTREAMETIAKTLVKHGVTRFLPTSVTMPLDYTGKVFDLIRNLKGKSGEDWQGAVIEGINMEGPFITAEYKGAHEERYICDVNFDFLKQYQDVIRLVTVAPDKSGGLDFIRRVTSETSIKVSLGHSAATYEVAMESFDAGVTQVTHLFNAMTPMHHRKPGTVTAALTAPNVYTEMICDTIHVHPAMFDFVMGCKGDHFILITDCMRAGGMPNGNYTLGELQVSVNETGARLLDGTLAGSILSLDQAIMNVNKYTHRSLSEVVAAASFNPACALGLEKTLGSIAQGKVADFAILDKEGRVARTIIQGQTVYQA